MKAGGAERCGETLANWNMHMSRGQGHSNTFGSIQRLLSNMGIFTARKVGMEVLFSSSQMCKNER